MPKDARAQDTTTLATVELSLQLGDYITINVTSSDSAHIWYKISNKPQGLTSFGEI